jgi:hypothetical protein
MRVVTTANRLEREVAEYLINIIERKSNEILAGVPVELYKERCAELRSYKNVLAELPGLVKKANE